MVEETKFKDAKSFVILGAILGFASSLLTWGIQQGVQYYNEEQKNLQIRQNMIEDLGTEIALLGADFQDLKTKPKYIFHIHRNKTDYFEANYHKIFIIPDIEIRSILIALFDSTPPNNYVISIVSYNPEDLNETMRHIFNALIILSATKNNNYNFNFNKRVLNEIKSKFIYKKDK
jgi:hypothetical protein